MFFNLKYNKYVVTKLKTIIGTPRVRHNVYVFILPFTPRCCNFYLFDFVHNKIIYIPPPPIMGYEHALNIKKNDISPVPYISCKNQLQS